MAVDKNLFPHDLAIAAIMKNEAPYLKEWLDYHLLAGVDHFYIYDNESADNPKAVLQPYIDAGVVTYIYYPGKFAMHASRNEAVRQYRFQSRYIAFCDLDEFFFPQTNRSIVEVVDEILATNPQAVALSVHWHLFGSSYHETADYSRGVMQRFTHRAKNDYAPIGNNGFPDGNSFVKTITNPRYINYSADSHNMQYFEGRHSIDEAGNYFPISVGLPVVTSKIVVNHYVSKSREEYYNKSGKGSPDYAKSIHDPKHFTHDTPSNEVFDDSILDYVKARRDAIFSGGGGSILEILDPSKRIDYHRVFNALIQNLSPVFGKTAPSEYFVGKIENFLTCLSVSSQLKGNFIDERAGNFFEEISLEAINRTLAQGIEIADLRLMLSELPNVLMHPYPVVDEIRSACMNLIPPLMNFFRMNRLWKEYTEMNYLLNMLRAFGVRDKIGLEAT